MDTESSKKRILVVDDTTENIDVLVALLKDEYRVAAARNGEKALKMVAKNPPDLILLDIMMPGMDGYEVCRRLKAEEATQAIPVIFVTALSEAMDEAKGFKLGAIDYITKPFVPVVVLARVKTHLALADYQHHLEDMVRQRTQQLEEAKSAAQAANKAKSEFLMNMSHEMRTPLNGILTASGFISACTSTDELLEIEGIIHSSSQSLLQTVENILDFTRCKDGELALENLPFRLDKALAKVKTEFFHKGRPISLDLGFNLRPEDLPNALMGDEACLVEVLNHLLENAAKFTIKAPKATLSIDVAKLSDTQVVLKFSLKDDGIGIASAHFKDIFEPFSQVDASSTRQYDGVGIGLSACQQMVELMGGDIWVESQVGQGSTFRFTAPFQLQETQVPFERRHLPAGRAAPDMPADPLLPVDPGTFRTLLDSLSKALKQSDPKAIRADLARIRRYDMPEINRLTRIVDDYEYEQAILLIQEILGPSV